MELDTSLLNTQQSKVGIKGMVLSPSLGVLNKEDFRSPSTKVANLTYEVFQSKTNNLYGFKYSYLIQQTIFFN